MDDKLLNVEEACEYLGISRRMMDKLTSQKQVTYILASGRKFRKAWLNEWIDKNKIEAVK